MTIAIPDRWSKGAFQIKTFIEDYARRHGVELTVSLTGQFDSGQIWLMGDAHPDDPTWQAAWTAAAMLSTYLNSTKDDPWKGGHDVTEEDEREMELVSQLLDRDFPA